METLKTCFLIQSMDSLDVQRECLPCSLHPMCLAALEPDAEVLIIRAKWFRPYFHLELHEASAVC